MSVLHPHHSDVPREAVRVSSFCMCVHVGEQMLIKKKNKHNTVKKDCKSHLFQ